MNPFSLDGYEVPTLDQVPPLARVHVRVSSVTPLHRDRDEAQFPPVLVRGVARIDVERDEIATAHRLVWQRASDGSLFHFEVAESPDPRVAAALAVADDGRPGDDLLAILAVEVRRLRGERRR